MRQDLFATRLEDLRKAEYGSRAETVIRYTVMCLVMLALTFVLELTLVLAWGTLYFLLEGCVALFVHASVLGTTRLRYGLALAFYMLSGLCFMSLPLYFIAAEISPALTFAGSAGLVGLLLYTLQRPEREKSLIVADCVQILLMAAALMVILHAKVESWPERIMVLLIALGAAGYYIGSMVSGWRQQEALRKANQRYAHAQKARALGQFVGGVAHDFNNQLTAILGHLDLFEHLESKAERATAVSQSRAAAERAAMTVQQLLASSGRMRLFPAPVAMDGFAYDLADVLTDLLEPGMTVEVTPPGDSFTALADRDMLETSAIQLCLNAQDATGAQGTLRLSIALRRMPLATTGGHGSCVALIIEDDGPGVSEEALPLLAEPFYTTKPVNEGRGLGLAAVSGFARQSGGSLLLEHSTRGGLRASILLPEA
jgi:signal transduction histidine kinase